MIFFILRSISPLKKCFIKFRFLIILKIVCGLTSAKKFHTIILRLASQTLDVTKKSPSSVSDVNSRLGNWPSQDYTIKHKNLKNQVFFQKIIIITRYHILKDIFSKKKTKIWKFPKKKSEKTFFGNFLNFSSFYV